MAFHVKRLLFFDLLFLFYIRQFFGGNLNTENVMVRTDELLYSKDQILNTKKEFCSVEDSVENDIIKNVSLPLGIKMIRKLIQIFLI